MCFLRLETTHRERTKTAICSGQGPCLSLSPAQRDSPVGHNGRKEQTFQLRLKALKQQEALRSTCCDCQHAVFPIPQSPRLVPTCPRPALPQAVLPQAGLPAARLPTLTAPCSAPQPAHGVARGSAVAQAISVMRAVSPQTTIESPQRLRVHRTVCFPNTYCRAQSISKPEVLLCYLSLNL